MQHKITHTIYKIDVTYSALSTLRATTERYLLTAG